VPRHYMPCLNHSLSIFFDGLNCIVTQKAATINFRYKSRSGLRQLF